MTTNDLPPVHPDIIKALKESRATIALALSGMREGDTPESTDLKFPIFKKNIEMLTRAIAIAENGLFWTYELDGEIQDHEFYTKEEAQDWADEKYAEECAEESPANNQTFECDAFSLIEYCDDDDGERHIFKRIDGILEYTHYHGDHAEHFNQSDYI